MMARHSTLRATGVVSIFGAAGPALDEIGLSAWIAQAEPGETMVYHRGFLAVDTEPLATDVKPFSDFGRRYEVCQWSPTRHCCWRFCQRSTALKNASRKYLERADIETIGNGKPPPLLGHTPISEIGKAEMWHWPSATLKAKQRWL